MTQAFVKQEANHDFKVVHNRPDIFRIAVSKHLYIEINNIGIIWEGNLNLWNLFNTDYGFLSIASDETFNKTGSLWNPVNAKKIGFGGKVKPIMTSKKLSNQVEINEEQAGYDSKKGIGIIPTIINNNMNFATLYHFLSQNKVEFPNLPEYSLPDKDSINLGEGRIINED